MRKSAKWKSVVQGLMVAMAILASGSADAQQETLKVALYGAPPWGDEAPASARANPGFMVELMNAIAEEAGFQVEYAVTPVGQLVQAALDKKADVFAGPITITEERRALGVEFANPPVSWTEGLVVAANDETAYSALKDLAGEVVGVPANTLYEALAKDTEGLKEVKSFPGTPEMAAALAAGEIKALLTVAEAFAYGKEEKGLYPQARLVESYVPVIQSQGGVGLRGEETELLEKINAALSILEADGTLNELRDRYHFSPPA